MGLFLKSSLCVCGAIIAVTHNQNTVRYKDAINTSYRHFYHNHNSTTERCDKTKSMSPTSGRRYRALFPKTSQHKNNKISKKQLQSLLF